MLLELAGFLVIAGILLLIIGILIARQYTLRAKMLTAFLVIVLVSLGALSSFDNYIMGESLTDSANRMLAAVARQYAEQLDNFNRSNLKSIQTEAKLPAMTGFLARKNIEPYYRQTVLEILKALHSRQGERVMSYGVLDANGINLLDTVPGNIGINESHQPYFRVVMDKKTPYNSPILFSELERPAIYFSSPIQNQAGEVLGVLRAKYDAEVLEELIKESRGLAGRGSFAILLDENLLRLAHGRRSDLQFTLANKLNDTILSGLKAARLVPQDIETGYAEETQWINSVISADYSNPYIESNFYGLGTDMYSAAVAKLETMPWIVVHAQSQDIFLEPVDRQTTNALILAVVVAMIVIFIVMGVTHFLLRPIRRLTGVVEGIGDGKFNATAKVEANDEIGGLANAFNEMTNNIKKLIVDLEDEVEDHKSTADNLRKLSVAIEQSPVSVMITDLDGTIEYVNPEFCKVTGYRSDEVVGKNPRILKSGHTPESQYKSMWNAISTGQAWNGELYNKKKNGDLYWVNATITPIKNKHGESTHYLAIKEDVSLRKEYEERLLYQASYDKLTELPNRSLVYDRLQQAIANAVRDGKYIALLYMDFDHFKNINDTLGHSAGDKFLVEMTGRLKGCIRDIDTVARLGGDEFLIMIAETGADIHSSEAAYMESIQNKTREVLQTVSRPCLIDDMEFSVTASIGIAIFPRDGNDPHMLLKNADTAMYRSKRKGRGSFEVFSPDMSDTVFRRVELDNKLRHALDDGKFHLNYQAMVETQTRKVVGAEVLLRWTDADLGDVPPDIFVPLAEESGLIVDIGSWVFETACADIQRLKQHKGNEDLYIAVNLSSRQFRGKGIANQMADVLARHQLTGDCLELEITERLLMKDVPDVIAVLNQFKEMNIRLSIDDFGTGYSSLSYLKRFPFDVLKIDKAFVQDIETDPDDAALCAAIIAMAHSLGLSVIGEGVENEHQFDFLSQRGTEIVQGFYVSRPMDITEFTQFVTSDDGLSSKVTKIDFRR